MNFYDVVDIQKFTGTGLHITKEDLLPNIAYIKDGKIAGTMFDGLSFDVDKFYIDDKGDRTKPDFGLAHRTKADWLRCIEGFFEKGYNVDALNDAVAEMKEALNLDPEYRYPVFCSTLYPVRGTENFGEINGNMTDLTAEEDRIGAMKWYYDEIVRQFNSKGYEHLELMGFYWYWESIFNEEDYITLPKINDYVRSIGLHTIWAPFFKARGWNRWKELGFDKAAMQPNYFPGRPDLPNCGTFERIGVTNDLVSEYDMGLEMELSVYKENFYLEAITGFKEYYQEGIKTGFINRFHTYWINKGPVTVRLLCESDDKYIRSAYDELYRFIHKTLTLDDIWMDRSKKGKVEFK